MGNSITALGIPEIAEGLVCCTTSALSTVCSKCSVNHPRFVFSLFLIFGTVASFMALNSNMRQLLNKIPYFCTAVTTDEMCDSLVGYSAVYRICFSLCLFYIIFAVLMINTSSTNDFRYKIHNGYWVLKLVLLVLILIGAFHIPRHTEFGKMWMYAGLTGGFMFIIIQIFLVIDFAHSWSISWAEKVDTGNTNFWYLALSFSTILIYSLAITMAVFFYIFFTDLRNLSKCRGNMFLITFNVSHCVLASVISVLPRVQDEALGSGLLQSSVVTLYTMYLTWCTLSSEPDASCNPLGDVILEYDKASEVNGQALFDCVLMFALLTYACNVRPSTSKLEKLGFSLSKINVPRTYNYNNVFEDLSPKSREKNVEGDIKVQDDELVEYNYSYFHFVMFLASFQLMMVITNWHSPDEMADMKRLVKNWATVWIQLSSSFLCMLFYIWAIVTPLLVKIWGPCLGLDYESVPTVDDYEYGYGPSRRETSAKRARDDFWEGFDGRKNLMKSNRSRQSTTDSGMFDANLLRTHSRLAPQSSSSNARLSLTPHSQMKSMGASENTKDAVLDSSSISTDLKHVDKAQRSEGLQSRQSAENECSSGIGPLNTSESHDGKETSTASPQKRGKNSAIDFLRRQDGKSAKELSSELVNEHMLEDRNLNASLGIHGKFTNFPPHRANPSDVPLSSAEEVREISPKETNDDRRPLSKMIDSRRSKTPDRHDIEQSRPYSRARESYQHRLTEDDENIRSKSRLNSSMQPYSVEAEACRSGFSAEDSDPRPTSRLVGSDRPISSDGRQSRPPSRVAINNTQRVRDRMNDSEKTSVETVGSNLTRFSSEMAEQQGSETVEHYRKAKEERRRIFPQMQDHITWIKKLRKSGATLPTSKKGTALQSKQSEIANVQLASIGNKELKDVKEVGEHLSDRKPFQSDNQTSLQTTSEPSEPVSTFEKEKAKEELHTREQSTFSRHPFVSEQNRGTSINVPQATDVSKEIFRLQAKILKFQAKVVKTQQQILKMQEDDESQENHLPCKNPT